MDPAEGRVGILDAAWERCFRCEAVIRGNDKAAQILGEAAEFAGVLFGTSSAVTSAMEVQQNWTRGGTLFLRLDG